MLSLTKMEQSVKWENLLCTLFLGCIVHGAVTTASVSITKNDNGKSSSSVGVSKSANFKANNASSSTGNLTMEAYACWTGWPYSCESSKSLVPSSSYSYTEYQDRESSFFIHLNGYKKCNGNGTVTAN